MNRTLVLILATASVAAIPAAVGLAAKPTRKPPAASTTMPRATPADFLRARIAGMHMAATLNAQGIQPRAKGNGALKDVHWSEGIELWAAAIPGLFPPGSAHPQSRARPEIWKNKTDFDAKAKALGEAAARVTAAGNAGDLKAYAAAAEQVGAACKACHTLYRADQAPGR